MSNFGSCEDCNTEIEPVYFLEKEYRNRLPTGRVRNAVDYLVCPVCLKKTCVDNSFDGPWYKQIK